MHVHTPRARTRARAHAHAHACNGCALPAHAPCAVHPRDTQNHGALVGQAECYQLAAEAVVDAAVRAPDVQLTRGSERSAKQHACALYCSAVQQYACCRAAGAASGPVAAGGAPGHAQADVAAAAAAAAAQAAAPALRPDAGVNCGNSLAAWGELLLELDEDSRGAQDGGSREARQQQQQGGPGGLQPAAASSETAAPASFPLQLFGAAAACYRGALAQEEDALVRASCAVPVGRRRASDAPSLG